MSIRSILVVILAVLPHWGKRRGYLPLRSVRTSGRRETVDAKGKGGREEQSGGRYYEIKGGTVEIKGGSNAFSSVR